MSPLNVAMNSELEKRESAIWAELQEDCSFRISKRLRDEFDRSFFPPTHKVDEGYLEDYSRSAADIVSFLKIQNEDMQGKAKTDVVNKKKRIYSKPFERRLHLVDFVILYWERDGRHRKDWGGIADNWNKVHPFDQMTSKGLKRQYYRGITENSIIGQLVAMRFFENVQNSKGYSDLYKQLLGSFSQKSFLAHYFNNIKHLKGDEALHQYHRDVEEFRKFELERKGARNERTHSTERQP